MGISHEKLAKRTGVSRSYISLQLAGKRKVTDRLKDALRELAKDEPKRLRDRADRLEQLITGA